MAFNNRLTQAERLFNILKEEVWDRLDGRLDIIPYGYETYINSDIRQKMRYIRNETSKFIRYTPDYFIIDSENLEKIYLLELKTTQTPIYSQNRINMLRVKANIPDLTWQDIGQMEADAYDNYLKIQSLGVRLAILDYCSYNEKLLLCDFIENIKILHKDIVKTQTTTGSRTPYVNFYCGSMRSLKEFFLDEHNIKIDDDAYKCVKDRLSIELPITHHQNSPYAG